MQHLGAWLRVWRGGGTTFQIKGCNTFGANVTISLIGGTTFQIKRNYMKSKEERFLELILGIDIDNPVMDFDEYGDNLFWFDKEGNYIFEYNLENQWFWINYDKVWSVFEKEYNLNYTEIKSFMEGMVEEHLKLKDVTTSAFDSDIIDEVEEYFKLKGITPPALSLAQMRGWKSISDSRV